MNLLIYGLLHLASGQNNGWNVPVKNFESLKSIYLNNAITLSRTLKDKGIHFTLLTNQKDLVCSELDSLGHSSSLDVKNINFNLEVPNKINFYSAHFKLDIFRYFSSLENEKYLGLVDLDMVCLANITQCLNNLIQDKIPIFYDISDQVIPARGHSKIIQDTEMLGLINSEGRWSGGELLMGTPNFFSSLCLEIEDVYKTYTKVFANLHHQGDEMITSVALEKLRLKGNYIADAGTLGIVGRFWSVPVLHPQKPFKYYEDCFLLHLPADKYFLASLCDKGVESRDVFFEKLQIISATEKRSRLSKKNTSFCKKNDSQIKYNNLYLSIK